MSQSKNIEINKALLAEKKKDGCEDCGFNKHIAALALDHIDPRTKHVTRTGRKQNPGSMLSYNPEIFKLELAKCRVLCHNCHAIHTAMQNEARKKAGERLVRGKSFVRKMSDPDVRIAA